MADKDADCIRYLCLVCTLKPSNSEYFKCIHLRVSCTHVHNFPFQAAGGLKRHFEKEKNHKMRMLELTA